MCAKGKVYSAHAVWFFSFIFFSLTLFTFKEYWDTVYCVQMNQDKGLLSLPQQRNSNKMNLKVQFERKYSNTETERTNAAGRHSERERERERQYMLYTHYSDLWFFCHFIILIQSIVYLLMNLIWTVLVCWGNEWDRVCICAHIRWSITFVSYVFIFQNTSNVNSDDKDVTLMCLKNYKCSKWDIFDLPWCL